MYEETDERLSKAFFEAIKEAQDHGYPPQRAVNLLIQIASVLIDDFSEAEGNGCQES